MKLTVFARGLLSWYKKNSRDLPWRKTSDPYKIWISEIMLQQTTVSAVIPYYERWIKSLPTTQHVAKASLHKILKLWQGLGYYSRAKNIHRTAKILMRDYGGKIPNELALLRKLPGFGPYTSGAVLSIAFDQRQPIIDANVRRVVMRQKALRGVANGTTDQSVYDFLDEVMPLAGNNIFNQALMELGALVCRSRQPMCLVCPVRSSCLAYQEGIQEIIPAPKPKNVKNISAAIAVIRHGQRFLIQKRNSKGLLADLWEFPGGKIQRGESPEAALHREIREEIGASIKSAKYLMNLTHCYTDFRVKLHVWGCEIDQPPAQNRSRRWVTRNALRNYPMPSGSARIVESIDQFCF